MNSFKSRLWPVLLALLLVCAPRVRANNSGAVVLVNSHSANYLDYVHFLQPYFTNFGLPYSVLDISSNAVNSNLTNYALIIIPHSQLDTNRVYLSATVQSNIAWAVSNGVGLVSFDNVLASNNVPIYQFEQSIFGLGYTNPTTSGSVQFPTTEPLSTMHYITALHVTNETLTLSNENNLTAATVAGLTLPTNVTAVAECGGAPFVVIKKYGQGRAVQWASYDWMSSLIQGPINGLDDVVWRGFVWAARKPFVMRGMPHFATMRIDDVSGTCCGGTAPSGGPLWWVHDMVNVGFKPYLALFIDDITYADYLNNDHRLADVRNMATNGQITVSVHAGTADSSDFFYFDHATETEWSDNTMSNNYVRGLQFMLTNGFPLGQTFVPHFSEIGTNAFVGLTNLQMPFIMIEIVPGTVEYPPWPNPGASWLVGGPYRLYETPRPGQVNMPMFYADWLKVPNHPELNGKIFDCYTEIRNVGDAGEWAPGTDVTGSIWRGVQMLKRGFDSMTLGNIFTHEFYIQQSDGPAVYGPTPSNFVAIMQGITNGVAPYKPIYVTLDYGSQYVRATRTSQILSGDYDPVTGRVTATFSGYTDMPITAYYYTGADSAITNIAGTVPVFTGSTNVTLSSVSVPVQLVSPAFQQGQLVFTLTGQTGASYSIEGRTNSATGTWLSLQTVTLTNGPVVVKLAVSNRTEFVHARLLP